jgi:putative transcriptional regulator
MEAAAGESMNITAALALAFWLTALLTSNTGSRSAQYRSERQLSVGDILIANEKLGDPNFAESVVLIVQYDDDEGTVGIIINRQTDIPVSKIFPKTKHASHDLAYMGGPVAITAVQALMRLPDQTGQATRVMADVFITGAKELLEKSVASHLDASKFRVYLGYAGWAPGQLEAEIQLGAWSVVGRDPKIVFDGDPDSLWSRLIHESHMQTAFALTPISKSGMPYLNGVLAVPR